jgi:hypothetical protein
METKPKQQSHTPGPWMIERGVITSPTRPVAKIQPTGEWLHNVLSADAALIAAAPDMLEALESALPILLDESRKRPAPEWDALVRSFRAAIAKATGS